MKKIVAMLIFLASAVIPAAAQKDFGGIVRFNATVHDFGKVSIRDGAVSCSFEVTNISPEPVNILSVTTTCGCTTVKWTRTDIEPGGKGSIDVSYSNDEGPHPFDKALTVYVSALERPVILHVKGSAYKGRK